MVDQYSSTKISFSWGTTVLQRMCMSDGQAVILQHVNDSVSILCCLVKMESYYFDSLVCYFLVQILSEVQ